MIRRAIENNIKELKVMIEQINDDDILAEIADDIKSIIKKIKGDEGENININRLFMAYTILSMTIT